MTAVPNRAPHATAADGALPLIDLDPNRKNECLEFKFYLDTIEEFAAGYKDESSNRVFPITRSEIRVYISDITTNKGLFKDKSVIKKDKTCELTEALETYLPEGAKVRGIHLNTYAGNLLVFFSRPNPTK